MSTCFKNEPKMSTVGCGRNFFPEYIVLNQNSSHNLNCFERQNSDKPALKDPLRGAARTHKRTESFIQKRLQNMTNRFQTEDLPFQCTVHTDKVFRIHPNSKVFFKVDISITCNLQNNAKST